MQSKRREEEEDGLEAWRPSLPAEMWVLIFSYITSFRDLCLCAMVCRAWQTLSRHDLTHLELSFRQPRVDDEIFGRICRASPRLTHLSLSGCLRLTDEGIRALVAACPRIDTLMIDKCVNLTPAGLIMLTEAYSASLKVLKLTDMQQITNRCLKCL